MSSSNNRKEIDIRKLIKAGYNVEPINDTIHQYCVQFNGPPDSLYSGGVWKVVVHLTETYPYESPLVRFKTKIYHPNIVLQEGTICVNLLDDQWNSTFDLVTVFDMILPQLLLEPNPQDPLNIYAADLLKSDISGYEKKVKVVCIGGYWKDYIDRYAKPEKDGGVPAEELGDDPGPSEDANDQPIIVKYSMVCTF